MGMNENNIEVRPDPEALLAAIAKRKQKQKLGKLYIFLGMSPGVGKTYAMLLAAHDAKKNGKDIVVGVVETHGREETSSLVAGLEIIPKYELEHRGIKLLEMDLDAILKRNPSIVLVDELAHTNAPGSRHNKRWQDVEEILDKGIDVYSTLNVQHLESRKEAVEQIAKINVQETVPDSILDRAFQIQLIDLSVPDLLKRLKEGKVYLGDKAKLASENFFKEEKLTALREIALRLAAEKVDSDLKSFVTEREAGSTWPAVERLMVAIGYNSKSEQLIRAARKMAYNLECPWIALHVSTNEIGSKEKQNYLQKNLELARNLGAEVITLYDVSVFDAIVRVAKQNDVTKLILGRSSHKSFLGRSIFKRLLSQTNIDICVVGDEPKRTVSADILQYLKINSPLSAYIKAIFFSLLIALVNSVLNIFLGYKSISFLFLMGVLLLGLFFPLGPVLLSALITSFIWDYYFIPPIGSLYIKNPSDLLMCLTYFGSAITTGILMRRISKHQQMIIKREAKSRIFHQLIDDINYFNNIKETCNSFLKKINKAMDFNSDIILASKDGSLNDFMFNSLNFENKDKEIAVAKWAMENNKSAGLYTDTLSMAFACYIPIKAHSEKNDKIGCIAFRPNNDLAITMEDFELMFSVSKLLGTYIGKEYLKKLAVSTEKFADSEKLHHTLIGLCTAEVIETLKPLENKYPDEKIKFERLYFKLTNFWMLSKLTVGIFPLKEKLCDVRDILDKAKEKIKFSLKGQKIIIKVNDIPKIMLDENLMIQAMSNILLNSIENSSQVEIEIFTIKHELKIIIKDNGEGVLENELGRIFEKFYKSSLSKSKGKGLGLTIAKGIIRAHDGKITARNNLDKGLTIEIDLPLEAEH